MSIEKFRTSMSGDVLHSWAADAQKELDSLRAELETERMRLVACSVIALANTPESAASARDMHPDYQSPYCDDVARAIDREIALRAELAECRLVLKDARSVINQNLSPQHAAWAKKIEDALAKGEGI